MQRKRNVCLWLNFNETVLWIHHSLYILNLPKEINSFFIFQSLILLLKNQIKIDYHSEKLMRFHYWGCCCYYYYFNSLKWRFQYNSTNYQNSSLFRYSRANFNLLFLKIWIELNFQLYFWIFLFFWGSQVFYIHYYLSLAFKFHLFLQPL